MRRSVGLGIVVGAIGLGLGVMTGSLAMGILFAVAGTLVAMASGDVMGLEERFWTGGREPAAGPRITVAPGTPPPDLGPELEELLVKAVARAERQLADGTLTAFVLYDDRGGETRVRAVTGGLDEARAVARSIEGAERVVVVVRDTEARRRLRYEVAERRGRDRTLVFSQAVTGRFLLAAPHPRGRPAFEGEGRESLRARG